MFNPFPRLFFFFSFFACACISSLLVASAGTLAHLLVSFAAAALDTSGNEAGPHPVRRSGRSGRCPSRAWLADPEVFTGQPVPNSEGWSDGGIDRCDTKEAPNELSWEGFLSQAPTPHPQPNRNGRTDTHEAGFIKRRGPLLVALSGYLFLPIGKIGTWNDDVLSDFRKTMRFCLGFTPKTPTQFLISTPNRVLHIQFPPPSSSDFATRIDWVPMFKGTTRCLEHTPYAKHFAGNLRVNMLSINMA